MNRLIITLVFLLSCSAFAGTTWIVAPSGGDATTIQGGINLANAGDSIEVRAASPGGTLHYYEQLKTSNNGTSGSRITLKARAGDLIYIDGGFTNGYALWIANDYWTVKDLYIVNETGAVLSGAITGNGVTGSTVSNVNIVISFAGAQSNDRRGIVFVNKCNDLTISSNHIDTDGTNYGPGETDCMLIGGASGGVVSSNVFIGGNYCHMHNTTSNGSGHNDCIQTLNCAHLTVVSNICFKDTGGVVGGGGQGMYLEFYNASTDPNTYDYGPLLVYNNLVYGYGESDVMGINYRCEPNTNDAIGQTTVANNTVDSFDTQQSDTFRLSHGNHWVGGSLHATNNIFIMRRSSTSFVAINIVPPLTNLLWDYNHIYVPSASASDNVAFTNGNFYTYAQFTALGFDSHGIGYSSGWKNPLFVNQPAGNYQLTSSSPDVGTGANLSALFTNDITGSVRIVPWDIGAYAFTTDPMITVQPQNVNVNIGQLAQFSVTATGTSPITYYWFKEGTLTLSGSSSTYTTAAVNCNYNNNHVSVIVSNAVGTVTSSTALLTVNDCTGTNAIYSSQIGGGSKIGTSTW